MENRYDRQLRLWGNEGQRRLEMSRCLFLGSNALASEILKNLVSSGIGSYTIVDDTEVSKSDLRCNFFLEPSDVGSLRAECIIRELEELNATVQGICVFRNIHEFLFHVESKDLQDFNVVVVTTKVSPMELRRLSYLCLKLNTYLFYSQAFHLMGTVKLYCNDHIVYDIRSDKTAFHNFRLLDPFPELSEYCERLEPLDKLNNQQHQGIPFPALLLLSIKAFKQCTDKAFTFHTDGEWIRQWLGNQRRSVYEENFNQAIQSVYQCLPKTKIPENVAEVLQFCSLKEKEDVSMHCKDLEKEYDKFFLMAIRALKRFYNENSRLPTTSCFPEIKGCADEVSKLQELSVIICKFSPYSQDFRYQKEAELDFNLLKDSFLAVMARQPSDDCYKENVDISPILLKFLESFYNDYTKISLVPYFSNHEKFDKSLSQAFSEFDSTECQNYNASRQNTAILPKESPLNAYMIQLFMDYTQQNNRIEPNMKEFFQKIGFNHLTNNLNGETVIMINEAYQDHKLFSEENCESSIIATFLGGIVAQEVFKLVTHQFIPFANMFLWNGYFSEALNLHCPLFEENDYLCNHVIRKQI